MPGTGELSPLHAPGCMLPSLKPPLCLVSFYLSLSLGADAAGSNSQQRPSRERQRNVWMHLKGAPVDSENFSSCATEARVPIPDRVSEHHDRWPVPHAREREGKETACTHTDHSKITPRSTHGSRQNGVSSTEKTAWKEGSLHEASL